MGTKQEYKNNRETLIIIDGNSLLNRAFFALPLLQTKKGQYTNAVYGFVSMLIKLIETYHPDYLTVVFDSKEKTFRHEKFPQYKAHRDKAPDEMLPQLPILKELLQVMNIYYTEKPGYEADDLIGTIAKKAKEQAIESLIVTGDKDMLQLIDAKTQVLLTKKGITQMEQYDDAKVREAFGVSVDQLIDIKALTGDKSDNVPGVPGVGEKTAYKLINQFDNLETLYHQLDQVSGKLKNKIYDHQDQAFLSKELVAIDCSVALEDEFKWEALACFNIYSQAVKEHLENLEMESIVERIFPEKASDAHEERVNDGEIDTLKSSRINNNVIYFNDESAQLERLIEQFRGADPQASMVLYRHVPVNYTNKKQKDYYPEPKGGLVVNYNGVMAFFPEHYIPLALEKVIFPFHPSRMITHDLKALWHLFYQHVAVDLKRYLDENVVASDEQATGIQIIDTSIMSYIVDPTGSPFNIEDLVEAYQLNIDLSSYSQGWMAVCERGEALFELADHLSETLKDRQQFNLYANIELPLATVLARMEHRGITADEAVLSEREKIIDEKIHNMQRKIYDMAGEEFNLNSPKQLGHILFEKLGLPVIKKTKTGYSTDAQTLETLAKDYEICRHLLDYRQLHKLKTTYLVGLKELINHDTGKIHTTFNQTITATGRLSSTEPNLQNIPIRLEEGRKIRKAFQVERKDNVFLAADYSQIELRILAHVSQDENLRSAFLHHEDIHTQTAAQVFDVVPNEVTSLMRSHAKAVNFGIVYGISDYGLSVQLGITRKQAKTYIENYFDRFKGVKQYMEDIVQDAKLKGYVTTLFNRRRDLPDIGHSNYNIRSAAERTAINTPIQGTAADIIKAAMVKVENHLEHKSLLKNAKLLLQVHDELILETNKQALERVAIDVKEIMESIIEMDVPLVVDLKTGTDWYHLSDYEPGV